MNKYANPMSWFNKDNFAQAATPFKQVGEDISSIAAQKLWHNPKARMMYRYKNLANDPTDPYSRLKANLGLIGGLGMLGYGIFRGGKGLTGLAGRMFRGAPSAGLGKVSSLNPRGWEYIFDGMHKGANADIVPGWSPGMVSNDYLESKGIWNTDYSGVSSSRDRFRAVPTPRTPRLSYEQLQNLAQQRDTSRSLYLKSK